MRDDIHKRVPVSPAMRAVLRGCMRSADRQQPELLLSKAVPALVKDMRANLDAGVTAKLVVEADSPSLFGFEGVSAPPRSALQSEALNLLAGSKVQTIGEALGAAIASHITSVVSETNACMIAEGVSRSERLEVVGALSATLTEAAGPAIAAYLQGGRPAPVAKVQLDDVLALGLRAPGAAS